MSSTLQHLKVEISINDNVHMLKRYTARKMLIPARSLGTAVGNELTAVLLQTQVEDMILVYQGHAFFTAQQYIPQMLCCVRRRAQKRHSDQAELLGSMWRPQLGHQFGHKLALR